MSTVPIRRSTCPRSAPRQHCPLSPLHSRFRRPPAQEIQTSTLKYQCKYPLIGVKALDLKVSLDIRRSGRPVSRPIASRSPLSLGLRHGGRARRVDGLYAITAPRSPSRPSRPLRASTSRRRPRSRSQDRDPDPGPEPAGSHRDGLHPALTFDEPGVETIVLNRISINLTALDKSDKPIVLQPVTKDIDGNPVTPSDDSLDTFDIYCKLTPADQSLVLGTFEIINGNPDAEPLGDADPDPDGHPDADGHADADQDADADRNADADGHPDADRHRDPDQDADADATATRRRPRPRPRRRPPRRRDRDGRPRRRPPPTATATPTPTATATPTPTKTPTPTATAHADRHRDPDADQDADADRNRDPDADRHRDPDGHPDPADRLHRHGQVQLLAGWLDRAQDPDQGHAAADRWHRRRALHRDRRLHRHDDAQRHAGRLTALGSSRSRSASASSRRARRPARCFDEQLTANLKLRIKVKSVKAFGVIPLAGGNNCQTKSLSDIALKSIGTFDPTGAGGTLGGTYAISDLNGCGVLNGLVSPLTAGGGNTITVKLTPVKKSAPSRRRSAGLTPPATTPHGVFSAPPRPRSRRGAGRFGAARWPPSRQSCHLERRAAPGPCRGSPCRRSEVVATPLRPRWFDGSTARIDAPDRATRAGDPPAPAHFAAVGTARSARYGGAIGDPVEVVHNAGGGERPRRGRPDRLSQVVRATKSARDQPGHRRAEEVRNEGHSLCSRTHNLVDK